uniref:C-C motif chemokine n=1 Tax=Moschus moschiferus TaxID=68415 RepID=A0A8C6DWF7_MOSMO
MKVSVAALFLLILTITSAVHSQPKIPESVNPPPTCCLKYHEKVLPRKLVVGYRQALNCYLPAIIFITKRKQEICTNADDDCVQEYIKDPRRPLQPPRRLAWVNITRWAEGQAQIHNLPWWSGRQRSPSLMGGWCNPVKTQATLLSE